jgi:predicted phage terminase large subunit-like protein
LLAAQKALFARRGTLVDFIEAAWPYVVPGKKFIHNWHIDVMAEHLDAVGRKEIKKLIINIPPGMMKSLTTCVFWPVYEWTFDSSLKFMFASRDLSLTVQSNRQALALIQTPWFQTLFGKSVQLQHNPAVSCYETLNGGERFATSVEGKATGHHPNIKVVDDPLKAQEVSSLALERVIQWWSGVMASRGMSDPNARDVIIMQRLHERDLAGYCLQEEDGWVHLRLPMEYNPSRPCITNWGRDPRIEPGELLCPEMVSKERVALLRKTMGSRVSAAQLDQEPAPEDVAIFHKQNFRHVRRAGLPETFDTLIQSWDCTFKDETTSDYVAGQIWGVKGADFYLLDEVHDRLTVLGTCDAIRAWVRKWPRAGAILVEDKANGSAVMQILQKEIAGLVPVQPEGGKIARANAIAPLYESHNVYHIDPIDAPWVEEFELEMLKFPVGRHDDRVDSCSQALLYLRTKMANLEAALKGFEELRKAFAYYN